MTHWKSLTDTPYLGAWDFPQERTGTIVKVEGVKLPGTGKIKANRKPVLHFKGSEKPLVVNATIGKTIAAMYGPDIEKWVGKRITMYATTCRAADGSGDVDCVRVRPMVPKGVGSPIESQPVDSAMRDRQIANASQIAEIAAREPGEEG